MPALPSEVSFGTVKGKILTAVKDTNSDPDTYPDAVSATGTVSFTPTSLLVSMVTDVIILPQKISVSLDNNGAFTVDLVATDDPDLHPIGWTYRVDFAITQGSIPTMFIQVLTGQTHDLSDLIIVGSPPAPAQIDMILSRLAALEAEAHSH